MKRILFVDDDTNVLNGLRRSLYSMRGEWQMEFADSGESALKVLGSARMDAIVTDARMPCMDGLQLLNQVKKTCPHMVRILLSGQTQQDALARSLAATHLFLSKPCDTELLKHQLRRTMTRGETIQDETLRNLICQLGVVPSLPMLFTEAMKEFNSAAPNLDKIARIVAMDMGMSSAVLHFLNSGYFGQLTRGWTFLRVFRWLGLDTVRELLAANRNCAPFDSKGFEHFDVMALWSDSISTSTSARALVLSQFENTLFAEDAFAAGLFLDIGQIVLARVLGPFYDSVVQRSLSGGEPLWKAELEMIGSTHADVGAYLLRLWGLPDSVLNAVTRHHQPSESEHEQSSAVIAAHIAEAFGYQRTSGSPISPVTITDPGGRSEIEDRLARAILRR